MNAQSIECAVSSENKLLVLKQLSSHEHLTDMEIHVPSLEQMYLHFNQSLLSQGKQQTKEPLQHLRSEK